MATKKTTTPSKEEFIAGFKKASKENEQIATKAATATKETAEKAKIASKEAAEKVKSASKTVASKTKSTTKKAASTAKKATTTAKKTVKKAATTAKAKVETAANAVKTSAVVQFLGDSYDVAKVTENAIANYHANSKKALKDIRVYIKPEDHKAYYVANGDYQGSVDL